MKTRQCRSSKSEIIQRSLRKKKRFKCGNCVVLVGKTRPQPHDSCRRRHHSLEISRPSNENSDHNKCQRPSSAGSSSSVICLGAHKKIPEFVNLDEDSDATIDISSGRSKNNGFLREEEYAENEITSMAETNEVLKMISEMRVHNPVDNSMQY